MTCCAVVLAAGAGRRFGGDVPKQLAELDGAPLLQHALDAVDACAADDAVLVLGARADDIAAAVRPRRARVVACEDWEEGLAASLRAGVAAAGDAEWAIVVLGDQAGVTAAALDAVVAAALGAPPEVHAVRCAYAGEPAHPVALRRALFGAVAELRGDEGAKRLLPDIAALLVEVGHLARPQDVDTPEDLEAMRS
jgi:CTP:molybdopterin cytidylyltransferase MocA